LSHQQDLIEHRHDTPEGFAYTPGFITVEEERALLDAIQALQFADVVMRGALAKRRTVHFGWTYGYYSRRTAPGPPLPPFLVAVRERVAGWAGIQADAFVEALVTEYPPGAAIGWHRDAAIFGDIVAGISLLASARMKFRPWIPAGADADPASRPRRTTHQITLMPRSGYLLTGPSRDAFEHSIPAVADLRYSITFRMLRQRGSAS
jgi:DNA oxidative demethylase